MITLCDNRWILHRNMASSRTTLNALGYENFIFSFIREERKIQICPSPLGIGCKHNYMFVLFGYLLVTGYLHFTLLYS